MGAYTSTELMITKSVIALLEDPKIKIVLPLSINKTLFFRVSIDTVALF